MLARVFSCAIKGLDGVVVEVELDTRQGAPAIMLTHNHPSREPNPSQGDVSLTRYVIEVAELLVIQLLDNIIVGLNHNSKTYHQASFVRAISNKKKLAAK
jgi:hypothetical protein